MKTGLTMIAAGILGMTAAWAVEGFEAPAYQAEQVVAGKEGWEAESTAVISAEQSAEGSQALKVEAGQKASKVVENGEGIQFYDMYVLPAFGEGTAATLKIGGAQIGFKKEGAVGKVFLANGKTQPTIESFESPLTAETNGQSWLRITVRVDQAKGVWDLFLDGKPVYADAALEKENVIELIGAEGAPSYLDALDQSSNNPLFVDSDKDGMPDAEEAAYGLNPYANDREGDADGDGISNVKEMFAGILPNIPGQPLPGTGVYLFVDNLNGNDTNSGGNSYPTIGASGPKASIKAAMEAAPNGAIIVVMKGIGVYDEGSRGVEGKKLTIKPVDPVTIK